MSRMSRSKDKTYQPKKTSQGNGTYTKKPHAGGENFHDGWRSGSTPSRSRRNKKPYRGQGK